MVISCRPLISGMAVLTSTMIWEEYCQHALNEGGDKLTLSAIWISSGDAPTDAPGIIPPSSVMAEASTTTTSSFLFGRSFV
jgi:hypothetical protein